MREKINQGERGIIRLSVNGEDVNNNPLSVSGQLKDLPRPKKVAGRNRMTTKQSTDTQKGRTKKKNDAGAKINNCHHLKTGLTQETAGQKDDDNLAQSDIAASEVYNEATNESLNNTKAMGKESDSTVILDEGGTQGRREASLS